MASVVVNGDVSGSVTLSAPSAAGTVTVTLPSTSGTMAVLPTATGVLAESAGGTGTTVGYNGFKNRIINGAMVIDQRNAGAASPSTTGFFFGVDRFQTVATGGGAITMQQSSSIVPPSTTFKYSLGATVLTADSSIAAGDEYAIYQPIEGYNIADIGFGTANAQPITLSFWVRSSIAGTYAVALYTSSRSYIATYTISATNTFEFKTVSLTADTSGTYNGTNLTGINVGFDLGSGSNFNGTASTWQSGSYLHRTSTSTNWIATVGATFYITGVQLEKGSTATSFDYRPYTTELQLCQRYYFRSGGATYSNFGQGWNSSTSSGQAVVKFPVPMRAAPTVIDYSLLSSTVLGASEAAVATASLTSGATTVDAASVSITSAALFTSGFFTLTSKASTSGYLGLGAEL